MVRTPKEYWETFRDSFLKAVDSCSDESLLKAWNSKTERTDFYKQEILPKIEKGTSWKLKEELFKVDAAFYEMADNGEMVPTIFIESENNAMSAEKEVRKLCSLSCPLTVLLTVTEWDLEQFPNESKKKILIEKWENIIIAYREIYPRNGVLDIIVGEFGRDGVLRFYERTYLRNEISNISEVRLRQRKIA